MDSIEAGAHRLDDGTTIHVCNCGRNLRVSKATYFRHKPSRLASIFLPPVTLSVAPDLPSPDLRHTPPPAASSSSSKRPHADLDGGELSSQKKGRSESPELVPASETLTHIFAISPTPRPMTLSKIFISMMASSMAPYLRPFLTRHFQPITFLTRPFLTGFTVLKVPHSQTKNLQRHLLII
ncbi:hypothetical protein EV424DRAFT_1347896 [Suillus variegatus]|nr:hypothetical protein EV424DRAFT_1347896 [Suillus variegatus]